MSVASVTPPRPSHKERRSSKPGLPLKKGRLGELRERQPLSPLSTISSLISKLGDIKGKSLDNKHKDEIEVLSYSWGVTNAGSIGTGARRQGELP